MNRNMNSHFAYNPTRIDISRSTFDRNQTILSTGNAGKLIPFTLMNTFPVILSLSILQRLFVCLPLFILLWEIFSPIFTTSAFPGVSFGIIGRSLWERIGRPLGLLP